MFTAEVYAIILELNFILQTCIKSGVVYTGYEWSSEKQGPLGE